MGIGRESVRGTLLSVLFFGGLALLSAPAVAQGGPSGPCEEGEHTEDGSHICKDGEWAPVDGSVDVSAPPPTATPQPPDNPLPPSPGETDPPSNPCLTCHPTPHPPGGPSGDPPEQPEAPKKPEPPKKSCSAEVIALNAASDLVARDCRWFSNWSPRCRAAKAAEAIALRDLSACKGPTIGPGFSP